MLVDAREGRALNRREAGDSIVHELAHFERMPVALPVSVAQPEVTSEELGPVMDQVRTALSGSVRFGWKNAHWVVRPQQMAGLLRLPADGRSELGVGGPEANRYFNGLARAVNRRPKEASFRVAADGVHVRVVPSGAGRKLDAAATAKALLAGALSTQRREASLVVVESPPRADDREGEGDGDHARARVLLHAVLGHVRPHHQPQARHAPHQRDDARRRADLLLQRRRRPAHARSAASASAPTIMDNEYQDAFGGGVSQVATTVFNAAWEAGLDLTVRRAHSLYISRYPLGRDATVNYPDVNLEFINDTKNWVVMRGENGDTGITIRILGAPTNRHVESVAGPLKSTGKPKVERVPDPTMHVGEKVVEDPGEPSRQVTVTRTVYQGDKVLYEETCTTSYHSEPRIVRVGTIPVAPPPPPPPANPPAPPPPPPGPAGRPPGRRRPSRRPRASRVSAARISSASQPGIRTGESDSASTVAWLVQPSATEPSGRQALDRYSKRKRARSLSGSETRTQIRSRSSKRHGAR